MVICTPSGVHCNPNPLSMFSRLSSWKSSVLLKLVFGISPQFTTACSENQRGSASLGSATAVDALPSRKEKIEKDVQG